MAHIIDCPLCRRRLQVAENLPSSQVRCPSCKQDFWLTAAGADQAPLVSLGPKPAVPARPSCPWAPRVHDDYGLPHDPPSGASAPLSAPAAEAPARQRSRAIALLLVAGLGGGALLVLAFAVLPSLVKPTGWQPPPIAAQPPAATSTAAEPPQRNDEGQPLVLPQRLLSEAEMTEELKPLFRALGDALTQRDAAAVGGYIDSDRMIEEMVWLGMVTRPPSQRREQLVLDLRSSLARWLTLPTSSYHWSSFEIRNVKKLQGNEAVVIARHRDGNGQVLRLRWWVTKLSGTWKVFDYDPLDAAPRLSAAFAINVAGNDDPLQPVAKALFTISDAAATNFKKKGAQQAQEKLQSVAGVPLPRIGEAMRCLAEAIIHLENRQYAAAQEAAVRGLDHGMDVPALILVRSVAQAGLGEWEASLRTLEPYRDLIGDDDSVAFFAGTLLSRLWRFDEAAASYRKSLDLEPSNPQVFRALLGTVAPQKPASDLGKRFAQLRSPQEHFETFAEDCRLRGNNAALEQLCLAMRQLDADFAPPDLYLALLRAGGNWTDEAIELFAAAVKKQKDPAKRKDYASVFLPTVVRGGGALPAYRVAPDALQAFAVLAEALKAASRQDELRELVALHSENHPADPALGQYPEAAPAPAGPPRRERPGPARERRPVAAAAVLSPSPLVGESWGGGRNLLTLHPPPQPSPTRGEGERQPPP
jgi:tetratricopeptide (TPR) repeat protein